VIWTGLVPELVAVHLRTLFPQLGSAVPQKPHNTPGTSFGSQDGKLAPHRRIQVPRYRFVAIKVKIPRNTQKSSTRTGASRPHLSDPIIKTAVAVFIVLSMVTLGIFAYYYIKYEKIIDRRMDSRSRLRK
jgi:hypothetical protein